MARTDIDAGKYVIGDSRVRKTGTHVTLLDTRHPDSAFVVNGSKPYMTLCVTHQTSDTFEKKSTAWQTFPHPDRWCAECKELLASGQTVSEKPVIHKERAERAPRATAARVPSSFVPTTVFSLPDKALGELKPSELARAGICSKCHGQLKAQDGHCHESGYPVRLICCVCRGFEVGHDIPQYLTIVRSR